MRSITKYLKNKPDLRDQVLNREELKRLARACGLSPEDARKELRKLGFILTENDHGLAIWKRKDD
jgi:hypothetical protein